MSNFLVGIIMGGLLGALHLAGLAASVRLLLSHPRGQLGYIILTLVRFGLLALVLYAVSRLGPSTMLGALLGLFASLKIIPGLLAQQRQTARATDG